MSLWACPKCGVLTNTTVCATCGSATEWAQPRIDENEVAKCLPVKFIEEGDRKNELQTATL